MTIPTLRCSIAPADPAAVATELLVLGPSLGTTSALWQPALAALAASGRTRHLRILRFDHPGHGASPATREPFTMSELADAVVRLVDETGGGRFHYVGLSLGGAIGIELALRHPDRLLSLGLFCTGARIGTAESWTERAAQARTQGTPSLVGGSATRWFAPGFMERDPAPASRSLLELQDVDDESYALCAEALMSFDRTADLGSIRLPVVTVSGESDLVTTPEQLAALAAAIPGAVNIALTGASHLAALERPQEAAQIVADLLDRASGGTAVGADAPAAGDDRADPYETGMRVRRAVLGDAHVDAAQARITPETAAFQQFLTRYAWGDVWARPGLERRMRSVATLAVLVAEGHHGEIAMHVRGALRNGLTREEISEVIMHTALYAGLPAANSAFVIAREVFAEADDSM
jgi:3-oxoadipate enol-lactonase/4-carboxymuconolactone decarboxylase